MADSATPAPQDRGGSPPRGDDPQAYEVTRATGALLFRRYQVQRELGRGGMGVVLLAQDTALDIPVAVKLVPDLVIHDTEAMSDLRQEVLRGIALTHPGIVRTHNFERDDSGAGIVMEYVDGETLAELKLRQPGGCFDPAQLVPWLEMLGMVLDYAHRNARIVHRDLKPRNIMLTRDGRIKVGDFGVAATLTDSITRNTGSGPTSGTPPYMSPQQARGRGPSPLDDVYSLGATLYELLTGKPPFFRGNIILQVMEEVPPSLTQRRAELQVAGKAPIPPDWEATIAACLAKDSAQRPQSAMEVAIRLKRGLLVPGVDPSPAAPPGPPPSTHSAKSLRSQLPPAGALPPPMPAPAPSMAVPPLTGAPHAARKTPGLIWGIVFAVVCLGCLTLPLLLRSVRPAQESSTGLEEASFAPTPAPLLAGTTPAPARFNATPAPAPVRESAEDFIRRYVAAGNSGNDGEQVAFFAERASYFDDGTLSREQIGSALAEYQSKWPERSYRLAGAIETSSTDGGNGAQVEFALTFESKNRYQRVAGRVRDFLTLRRTAQSWEITSIRSEPLEPSKKTPIFTAEIGTIRQEHNVIVEGTKVMKVTFPLLISGCQGRDVRVCLFVHRPDGSAVRGRGDNRAPNGQLTAQDKLRCNYDDTQWSDPPFTLYLPYANFELSSGYHDLRFVIQVQDHATDETFASSAAQSFTFTR